MFIHVISNHIEYYEHENLPDSSWFTNATASTTTAADAATTPVAQVIICVGVDFVIVNVLDRFPEQRLKLSKVYTSVEVC